VPHSSAVLGARVGFSLAPADLWTGWASGLCDSRGCTFALMPWSLRRHQQGGHLHHVTCSCYRRMQLLDPVTRRLFEHALEAARRRYCFRVIGYVVMPEHVHLLVSEPERETLAVAMQAMKQSVARRRVQVGGHFRQPRYYDFNVWSEKKRREKLGYIHRNPVRRGLVQNPEDWEWSS